MVKLIKGFVDKHILASGYHSWVFLPTGILKISRKLFTGVSSLRTSVFSYLSSSVVYLDSLKERDATLNEMTSNPSFPQGLSHLSSATLSRARAFISEHFICTLRLRGVHVRDFLRATIEMDLK